MKHSDLVASSRVRPVKFLSEVFTSKKSTVPSESLAPSLSIIPCQTPSIFTCAKVLKIQKQRINEVNIFIQKLNDKLRILLQFKIIFVGNENEQK